MDVLSGRSLKVQTERRDSHWPMPMLFRDLTPETHDHLMDLFWNCHNLVVHLVHHVAFYFDYEHSGTQFYSTFLHVCMLATGFRYADKTRSDMKRFMGSENVSSVFHEKAKSLANLELERPGGIPSIQALFLLADLEAVAGRDDTGWMFAGLCSSAKEIFALLNETGLCLRLVYDVGLHVEASALHLSEQECQLRHMVLWACIISDK
jgi:hypothetical protein